MPYFLDEFITQVSRNISQLRRAILGEKREKIYYDNFFDYWNTIEQLNVSTGDIVAIDSSDGYLELRNGNKIHIVRAIGVGNNDFEAKELMINPILQPIEDTEFARFRGCLREHIEHVIAIKTIREFKDSSKHPTILIDGSFYGRISHFPREINVVDFYDFLVGYYKTLKQLFDMAKKYNFLIMGVAKDSRTQFLRLVLLERLLDDILKQVDNITLKENIRHLWNELLKRRLYSTNVIKKLSLPSNILEKIAELFNEAIKFFSDPNLISLMSPPKGYSTPILLGRPIYTLDPLISSLTSSVESYIHQRFPRATSIYGVKFVNAAKSVLSTIPELPAMISFYVLFNKNDLPIRIDMPAYSLGIDKTIKDTNEWGFINGNEEMLAKIISLLSRLYAGPEHYNVLIEEADRRVKLHKRIIHEIYEKILMEKLDVLLEHSRGEKRVKFP